MEKFTCIICNKLLEFHKFSKTQQKLSRKTQNGKCVDCVSKNENKIPDLEIKKNIDNLHPNIEGLYVLNGYTDNVITKILNALKNVKWKKSLCRSVYSCGWEWVNYDGGKLNGWNTPSIELAKAISLLEIPKVDLERNKFNQIIFTKYHEDTYKCSKCQILTPVFNFSKNDQYNKFKICNNCKYNNQSTINENFYEGMAAHTDRFELGPIVWGITLKGSGFMRFIRHKDEKNFIDVPANGGLGYCMTGQSRYKWKHQPFGQERISMTIRAVPCNSPKVKELGFSE
tara:strand:+ start:1104 stop:1958 length:855 start_codon:yes stop_codon:yes gene_type:complete